jgi:hypothetical protein
MIIGKEGGLPQQMMAARFAREASPGVEDIGLWRIGECTVQFPKHLPVFLLCFFYVAADEISRTA